MKKDLIKKLLAFVLCATSAIGMVACGGNTPNDSGSSSSSGDNPVVSNNPLDNGVVFGMRKADPAYANAQNNGGLLKKLSSVPEYKDNGETMFISYMWGPSGTGDILDQAIKIVDECNITVLHPIGENDYVKTLPLQDKYGLYSILDLNGEDPAKYDSLKPENISNRVLGFNWMDEPYYEHIGGRLLDATAVHNQNYADRIFYSNLNPCWGGNENSTANGDMYGGLDYNGYVAHYADTVMSQLDSHKFISVDVYPLIQSGLTMRDDWLYTYENLAVYANAYDAVFHFYLCSTIHNGYRELNEKNLRYMVNVAMTYGGSAMSYFQWTSDYKNSNWGTALTSNGGLTIHDSYYHAQKINAECLSWDHIFMNFKWQETMCLYGDKVSSHTNQYNRLQFKVDEIDIIENISASLDTIVGRFTGANDEVGVMITNFADPDVITSNDEVSVKFKEANKAIVYVDGVKTVCDLNNGVLNIDIAPGSAAFVIPLEVV